MTKSGYSSVESAVCRRRHASGRTRQRAACVGRRACGRAAIRIRVARRPGEERVELAVLIDVDRREELHLRADGFDHVDEHEIVRMRRHDLRWRVAGQNELIRKHELAPRDDRYAVRDVLQPRLDEQHERGRVRERILRRDGERPPVAREHARAAEIATQRIERIERRQLTGRILLVGELPAIVGHVARDLERERARIDRAIELHDHGCARIGEQPTLCLRQRRLGRRVKHLTRDDEQEEESAFHRKKVARVWSSQEVTAYPSAFCSASPGKRTAPSTSKRKWSR